MEERKRAEGEKLMAAGAKCEKTSLFSRWKADWDTAASEYEKAATCFRVAKAMPRAIDAYVKASEAHSNLDNGYFMAAKHLETAAFICRDLKQMDRAAGLYEHASRLHQEDGRVDAAAESLCKGARVLEELDGPRGAALLVRACGLFDDEEDERILRGSVETLKQAVSFLLRAGRHADAAAILRKQSELHARLQQPHGVARVQLSLLVVLLGADDFEAAHSSYEAALVGADGFATADEAVVAERLINAYTAQSEEGVAACVKEQIFNHLENQVTRVARGLSLRSASVPVGMLTASGGGGGGASDGGSAGTGGIAAASAVAASTGDFGEVAPEDEFTDDLC